MNNLALDILTKKLKNATPDILERVSGYLDGILELSVTKYTLSKENQKFWMI
ncbi:MAG: hypothetical protein H7174_04945 [Flavobacterium sp.]|nr:hypothetical protein [Flavobacterium sp.]